MSVYECVFIIRPDLTLSDIDKITNSFVNLVVENFNGKLLQKEYWGLRNLAYLINKNKRGHYIMLCFDTVYIAIKEVERLLKINDSVLKYISIKLKKFDDRSSVFLSSVN